MLNPFFPGTSGGGSEPPPLQAFPNAVGGTATNTFFLPSPFSGIQDQYRLHTFLSSGNFEVLTSGIFEIEMVGGGGAGGMPIGGGSNGAGGGGGAGEYINMRLLLDVGIYSVEVGAGGSVQNGLPGSSGSQSSLAGIIASGGGGGGGGPVSSSIEDKSGLSGGSGGGGAANGSDFIAGGFGGLSTAISPFGFGNPGISGFAPRQGGGGGGAGSPPLQEISGNNFLHPHGGASIISRFGQSSIYLAGGGAVTRASFASTRPEGGFESGGAGATSSFVIAESGVVNTGGGGGGALGEGFSSQAGNGGSGLVRIRYRTGSVQGLP